MSVVWFLGCVFGLIGARGFERIRDKVICCARTVQIFVHWGQRSLPHLDHLAHVCRAVPDSLTWYLPHVFYATLEQFYVL